MHIGAIGGMSYTPYIYNTNGVSSASLNKVSGIGNDLLTSKTDFSNLTTQETTNPLKRGESLDFTGILSMQMQMSRMNAARVMKEPEKSEEVTQAAGLAEAEEVASNVGEAVVGSAMVSSVRAYDNADSGASVLDYAKAMEAYQPIDMYA